MRGASHVVRQGVFAVLAFAGLLTAGCTTPGGASTGGGLRLGSNPDEEVWAIRCITLTGPDQFQRAETYAKALQQVRGLKPELVQVLSDDDGTAVFYGRYQKDYGAAKGEDAYKPDHLHDLQLVRSLKLETSEVWPFLLASMDLLPTYKSPHPEWDLAKADGYWSLQVAAFYNTEDFHSRRSAAEEYCRILRDQGEEAYYFHGASQSVVCIGVYPKEAIAEVQHENALAGRATVNSEMVDPKMQDTQKRFPTSPQNGHIMYDIVRDPKTGEVQARVPMPSFAVKMPRAARLPDSSQKERAKPGAPKSGKAMPAPQKGAR